MSGMRCVCVRDALLPQHVTLNDIYINQTHLPSLRCKDTVWCNRNSEIACANLFAYVHVFVLIEIC